MIGRILRQLGQQTERIGATRRVDLSRRLPKARHRLEAWAQRPEAWAVAGIAVLFVGAVTATLSWVERLTLLREGQIARESYAARIDFDVTDAERTEEKRDAARQRAAHVYRVNESYVGPLRDALAGLPRAVAGKANVGEVISEVVEAFDLSDEQLHSLARYSDTRGEATSTWDQIVDSFFERGLFRRPIIDPERFQTELTQPEAPIALLLSDGRYIEVERGAFIDLKGPGIDKELDTLVAFLPADVRACFAARIRHDLGTTFTFDAAATSVRQESAAATVADEIIRHRRGELLFRRGDQLTADQVDLIRIERAAFLESGSKAQLWTQRAGTAGLALILTLLLGTYTWLYYTSLLRKPGRLLGLGAFLSSMLLLTVATAAAVPQLIVALALAPALLIGIVVGVAYDRRFAVGLVSLYALLACYALRLEIGYAALMVAAAGVSVWQLKEIRDRNRLVQTGAATGIVGACITFVLALTYRPFGSGWLQAALVDTVGAMSAGLGVGIFTLGILSSIERLFNVTTGLTLVELRDPRQPLLHELQRLAPGTWSHSLQVANIAEAAAEAIGADGLLTYVGALYHDVGKMNKATYFVENQVDGYNRHEKLSPAMSLLIIVGHVKDGLELAREFRLPRPLHHFIEAHHGTTLVEYFYNAARERAESGQPGYDQVAEAEYRYPGPKPRTKEAAVLMVADACESTSRTLDEPTPARLEQLVRTLSEKRLMDGQFDHCELTLRELRGIEDSIIKSLCAIHHSRVAYPGDEEERSSEGGAIETKSQVQRGAEPATSVDDARKMQRTA